MTALPPETSTPKRTIVYVDGFNLYYGALQGTALKWLNLEAYFCRLRLDEEVVAVKYFTAKISGSRAPNQLAYLGALSSLPRVEIILGKFKRKSVECKNPECPGVGRRFFHTREEKLTDVNIAVQMLDDACQRRCEVQVLVSGDSDLTPALKLAKQRNPDIRIVAYVPQRPTPEVPLREQRKFSQELHDAAHDVRLLPFEMLRHFQFPECVPGQKAGKSFRRPAEWAVAEVPAPKAPLAPALPGHCSWCHRRLAAEE